MRVALDTTRHMLDSGQISTDELRDLSSTLDAMQAGDVGKALLEARRDLLEIERSARQIPGASAELGPWIVQAQEYLNNSQVIDLSPLWSVLERHMGAAAQERENFDTRAEYVVSQYDTVRRLAGETTQKLGRLADTLRAQRHLGPMSMQAHDRYAQTLIEAESLLQEAHAEYRAAQQVTATFGADALNGLLDVFDFDSVLSEAQPVQQVVGDHWTMPNIMPTVIPAANAHTTPTTTAAVSVIPNAFNAVSGIWPAAKAAPVMPAQSSGFEVGGGQSWGWPSTEPTVPQATPSFGHTFGHNVGQDPIPTTHLNFDFAQTPGG